MSQKIFLEVVVLTVEAVNAWQIIAQKFALMMCQSGIAPDQVGEEYAELNDDGSLTIKCQAGPLKVEMRVPPEHWSVNNLN